MPRAVGRCGAGGSAVLEPLGQRVTAQMGVRSGQQGPLPDQGTEERRPCVADHGSHAVLGGEHVGGEVLERSLLGSGGLQAGRSGVTARTC